MRVCAVDTLARPRRCASTQAATALIAERPLLLDEPTVSADPLTRAKLLAVVADRAKAGAAVVYATTRACWPWPWRAVRA